MNDLLSDYMRLGATIYWPANNDLHALLNRKKLPELRSIVLCTEDAVLEQQVPMCIDNLRTVLKTWQPNDLMVFLRPRNAAVLEQFLELEGIEKIQGFVIPKADMKSFECFMNSGIRDTGHVVMPTIETAMAFCRSALSDFAQMLDDYKERILCIRVGGNDLMGLLGLRHPRNLTIYDTPIGRVIDDMVITFRPKGYEISAPVFDYIDKPSLLKKELELDKARGLMTKTAIHPAQIGVIQNALKIAFEDQRDATSVLNHNSRAVFLMNGGMCETATHRSWANRVSLMSACEVDTVGTKCFSTDRK